MIAFPHLTFGSDTGNSRFTMAPFERLKHLQDGHLTITIEVVIGIIIICIIDILSH